jgi:serine phosphatase RsbU (regulator of sigma subunit)
MAAAGHIDPADMLRAVNDALLDEPLDEPYCTIALALLEPTADGTFGVVSCAGHCAPLIRRGDGSVSEVDATDRPLGLAPGDEFRAAALHLRAPDTLVLVSDTVVRDRGGCAALKAALAEGFDAGAQELASRIEAHAVQRQFDSADNQLAILVAQVGRLH